MERPTKAELRAAWGTRVPDVLAPRLTVLFVGINPGLYSGAVGHHFARPGNRFWPMLQKAGFTDRLLAPSEERELLAYGLGITNIVDFATAAADQLTPEDLQAGGKRLMAKIRRHRPAVVVVLGLKAYQIAFGRAGARFGPQDARVGPSAIWVLPNPSGLNASYQLADLVRMLRRVRRSIDR